jgi:Holliday junction resolvase
MRRAAKVDANQDAIVVALRAAGASVQSLAAVGKGCPDLLCAFRGLMYLLEVKRDKAQPNELQVRWHEGWRAAVHVVRTPDDALRAVGAIA